MAADAATAPGLPLLAAQWGIWAAQQLDPDSAAFNTAEYLAIDGPLDPALFEAALRRTVAETDALRVRFSVTDGVPRQHVLETVEATPEYADLSGEPDPQAAAHARMAADLDRPVDLTSEPVFAHALLRTGPERHLWYHRVHHIALDGYGLSLVARRVAEVYTALARGDEPGERPFGTLESVLAEERAYLTSERHARDRGHWTERFADRPHVPTFAAGGRTALPARGFRRHVADLGPRDSARLRELAGELGVTWPDVVLALTAAALHRHTGAPEVVLSVPATARLGSVSLRVPCMVRNILPLRLSVGPGDTLRELAVRTSAELRAATRHQRYRYEQLRRDTRLIGGERRLSGPGVNIMPFAYALDFGTATSTAHNLTAGPVDDFSVNVYDRGEGGLRVAFDAHPDLYTEDELADRAGELLSLLRDATPVGVLGRAPAAARTPRPAPGRPAPGRRVTVLDGGPLPGPVRSVPELIAARAAENGERTALVAGDHALSYAELHRDAEALAARMAELGVRRGALVAVLLPRGAEAITAVLAAFAAGAAYCPLDVAAPAARTTALLDDAAPALVVTVRAHADRVPAGTPVLLLDDAEAAQAPREPGPAAEDAEAGDAEAADAAYVIFTSGSTGTPKGVRVGQTALARFVAAATERYGVTAEDRILQFAPLHFDASVEEIFVTLCAGATLVLRTPEMTESVDTLLRACAHHRVTVLDLPTAYWNELAYAVAGRAVTLPASLRAVVIGGESAHPERVDRWREAVGDAVRLFNTYGPTEATVVATVAELSDPGLPRGEVPIGLPLPGTTVAVVSDGGAGPSEGGELYLLGDSLALGYLGRPEQEAAAFAPLTELPGGPRAYRTGDLAEFGADGQLRFLGRADDEFKISGHRVQPAEVESALLGHPRVREAAVVGQELPDGTKRLVAHVVTEAPAPDEAELRAHARAALPAPLVPALFVPAARLPRTGTGKIDRRALTPPDAVPADPAPEPRGETVGVILEVWQQALGGRRLTAHDDFFDAGGQSLQAIQAANRLTVRLGRDVRVATLFQHPTAAGLAAALEEADARADAGDTASDSGDGAGDGAAPGLPAQALEDAVLTLPAPVPSRPPVGTEGPGRVLLTGATGFVGAQLLAELLRRTTAEIVCPVRAPDAEAAGRRLERALAAQGLTPEPEAAKRIVPLPADLARPRLGLDEAGWADLAAGVDLVCHNGAMVSVMREYASLRSANVEATRDLLTLAAVRGVPFHLVSTLSVAQPRARAAEVPEDFLPAHPGLVTGYQQSKWVAERLAEQAAGLGLPATVHRLGRVTGEARTGHVNPQDVLWGVLRTGVPHGVLPELFEREVWTPVDYVARALVHVMLAAEPPGGVLNHAPAPPIPLAELYEALRAYGYPVRSVPIGRWHAELTSSRPEAVREGVAATTLSFFDSWEAPDTGGGAGAETLDIGTVRAGRAAAALDGSGVTCPPPDRELVFRYLDHCVATGALPAPTTGQG